MPGRRPYSVASIASVTSSHPTSSNPSAQTYAFIFPVLWLHVQWCNAGCQDGIIPRCPCIKQVSNLPPFGFRLNFGCRQFDFPLQTHHLHHQHILFVALASFVGLLVKSLQHVLQLSDLHLLDPGTFFSLPSLHVFDLLHGIVRGLSLTRPNGYSQGNANFDFWILSPKNNHLLSFVTHDSLPIYIPLSCYSCQFEKCTSNELVAHGKWL